MPTKPAEPEADTRQRMIDAATALFAAKGADRASLRELTASAKVNLAAVNYHFGSKDALTETVFGELSARVNRQRIEELAALLAAAKARRAKPSVEAIVGVFIEPYLPDRGGDDGKLLAQLILKHRLTPSPMMARLIRKHFDPMAKQFVAALAEALPDVDAGEFVWRYGFMVSAVVLTVTDRAAGNRVARLSNAALDARDTTALKAALIRFIAGGMRA